jgi:tetratricopeptide (TPR) repeat protein
VVAHCDALAASLSADQSSKALIYSEAGMMAEKMDITFSTEYYRQAVPAHCDALEFKAAALLQVRMAKNYEKHDNLPASIEEFHKASRFFAAAGMVNEAEQALEKAAYLLGKTGYFVESSNTYKQLAMSQLDRNTTIFNAPRYALRSVILLFVDASSSSPIDLSDVQNLIDEMCTKDCRFIESRELAFVNDILHATSCADLDHFADCVYSFYEIAELDDMMLELFEQMRENIVSNKQTKQT